MSKAPSKLSATPRLVPVQARFAPDDLRDLGRLAFLASGEVIWEAPQAARFLCPVPLWRGNGVPPAIRDVLPAGWGLQVLRDAFAERNLPVDHATLLMQGLAWEGPGCLVFGDQKPSVLACDAHMDDRGLRKLARAMDRLRRHAGPAQETDEQLAAGSGLSRGMRPKLLLGVDAAGGDMRHAGGDLPAGWSHWLVKAADTQEPHAGQAEWIWAKAAGAAGLPMPETRLFDDRWFGVRRFDRPTASDRLHLLSAQAAWDMLHAGRLFQHYGDLLDLTRSLTHSEVEVERMLHWVAVNLALGNRDDHPGNYGFLAGRDTVWRVGPPYDITPVHGDAWGFLLPPAIGNLRGQVEALASQARVRTGTLRRILEGAQAARMEAKAQLEERQEQRLIPARVAKDLLRRLPAW